jgi:hypothetical protein
MAEAVDEIELGGGDGEDRGLLSVPTRQSICHDVGAAGLLFHQEIEVEELADPVMLGNRG